MEFARRFKVLVCAPSFAFDEKDLEGARLRKIIAEIEGMGFQVTKARRDEDAELVIRTDSALGCIVVDWGRKGAQGKSVALIEFIRKRGLDVPIVVLVRRHKLEDIPAEIFDDVDAFCFLAEESAEFIAKNTISRLRQYAETLRTPFFGALLNYNVEGHQLFTCPGHSGGQFYARSPIGRIFREHLGEAVFRDDLDNSVLQLGDLLVHEGPALKAQKEAAQIFGAEKTYFVLNGTSTSNKIVLTALLAEGDLVLFDRNNHKAANHGALFQAGAIPIFVETSRNAHGLIGPINYDALDETKIRESIKNNPLIKDKDAWKKPKPFRVAVFEQVTYDGTIYSADMVLAKIGHLCEHILFDEAWGGFMKFHPLFKGRYGMGLKDLGPDSPGIYVSQSTHKQLASFSQASQIHVRDKHIDGQKRRVPHKRFNEFFLLHSTTSPFYPLFASLDVGAQMMRGKSGEVLWDDTIRLGIEIRKKMRALKIEFGEKEKNPARRWFFEPFVPKVGKNKDGETVPWEFVPTDLLASDPAYWELRSDEDWHGFGHANPSSWAITDPCKLTILTPGFKNGKYDDYGIPAPVVAEYLRSNRIVPEKNDLNSLLFLLTPGVEGSKAGTLLSYLVSFKKLYDNAPLAEVMPEFVAARRERYGKTRLKDLCDEMHAFYKKSGISTLQAAQFRQSEFPDMVMMPNAAVRTLVRNDVDYVPLEETAGRIAATLWLVYPPGIATVIPGERLPKQGSPQIAYLTAFENGSNLFAGFDNEIQGLYREKDEATGKIRFYTYVVQENIA